MGRWETMPFFPSMCVHSLGGGSVCGRAVRDCCLTFHVPSLCLRCSGCDTVGGFFFCLRHCVPLPDHGGEISFVLQSCQLIGDAQLWVHRVANALSAAGTPASYAGGTACGVHFSTGFAKFGSCVGKLCGRG